MNSFGNNFADIFSLASQLNCVAPATLNATDAEAKSRSTESLPEKDNKVSATQHTISSKCDLASLPDAGRRDSSPVRPEKDTPINNNTTNYNNNNNNTRIDCVEEDVKDIKKLLSTRQGLSGESLFFYEAEHFERFALLAQELNLVFSTKYTNGIVQVCFKAIDSNDIG